MSETTAPVRMPDEQARTLRRAFRAFSDARDPASPRTNRRLASVLHAATAAGWSRRTTAAELGISRERALRISQFRPSREWTVEPYRRGAQFPAEAVAAFAALEQEAAERRDSTGRAMAALIRAARCSGWPYHLIGDAAGATGEWMRQVAEQYPDAGDAGAAFDPYVRPLKGLPEPRPRGRLSGPEKARLRELAALARGNTKSSGRTAAEREASEELSALIIAAKDRRVSWPDLDEACGYRPGSARARAVRHGYGKLPPSMTAYAAPADKKPSNV